MLVPPRFTAEDAPVKLPHSLEAGAVVAEVPVVVVVVVVVAVVPEIVVPVEVAVPERLVVEIQLVNTPPHKSAKAGKAHRL